jgi:3-oxoadipate enol-lactonase
VTLPVWEDGEGPPLVLLHAGVADHRMWDSLVPLLSQGHRVVRYDLRGFGEAPAPAGGFSASDDLAELLDALRIDRAALVGCSNGGRVALQFAIERPERVTELTLISAPLPEHDWSAEVIAAWEAEEATEGVDAVVEANLRSWLAGPRRRLDDLDPGLRALAADMARKAEEGYVAAQGEERNPDPPLGTRLGAVTAPTLVVDAALDFEDFSVIADRIAAGIPGARRATIDDAGHVAPLERPDAVAALLA